VWNLTPFFLRSNSRCSVISLPARSILSTACGRLNPWKIGTTWVTPSPQSNTTPVVFALAYLYKLRVKKE